MVDHDLCLETADRNDGHRIPTRIADARQTENDCALLDPKQVMPSARLACGGLPDCKQVHIAARNMQDEIDMIDRQWSMALERDRGGRRTCVPGRGFKRRRPVGAAHSPDTSWTYSPPSASSS